MGVIELQQSTEFAQMLQSAGKKSVFVDFFATWCGPCKAVAPKYEELSNLHSQAIFLKVDIDKLDDVAQDQGITSMPTFMCFKSTMKKDELRGGDPSALETFVHKWAASAEEEDLEDSDQKLPKGQMNLKMLIDPNSSECLNESDDHKLGHAFEKEGYLESDVDEQLLMTIGFNQKVKLHSFMMHAEGSKAPKTIKFFADLPHSPDFDSAESMVAIQEFNLTPEDLKEGNIVNLKYVKFQNVQAVTVFVKDNQGGEETTQIDKLVFIGSTVNTTNMNDFKRVAGKKGESH